MTPADVENLMSKTSYGDPKECLNSLIGVLRHGSLRRSMNIEKYKRRKINHLIKEQGNESSHEWFKCASQKNIR